MRITRVNPPLRWMTRANLSDHPMKSAVNTEDLPLKSKRKTRVNRQRSHQPKPHQRRKIYIFFQIGGEVMRKIVSFATILIVNQDFAHFLDLLTNLFALGMILYSLLFFKFHRTVQERNICGY